MLPVQTSAASLAIRASRCAVDLFEIYSWLQTWIQLGPHEKKKKKKKKNFGSQSLNATSAAVGAVVSLFLAAVAPLNA